MKATSLFGGVQVVTILMTVIRSKVIALLIGPTGMGIAGLLNTSLRLVTGVTNLGLPRSGVKEISFATGKELPTEVSKTVAILRKLVWGTAALGAIIMMLTSPWLSEQAFGNKDYTISFVWISIAVFFTQLSNGQLAVLQGLRKLNSLAKANVLGSVFGLLFTVPLYYFLGVEGIVPAIVISAILSFGFTFYFLQKTQLESVSVSFPDAVSEGKSMIYLGLTLSVSSIVTLLVAYILQVYISAVGGVAQVGLYSAAIVILNTYVGIIFTAMATDYFPRLSAIANVIEKVRYLVFEQAFVAILLITPIIVVFLAFAPFFIEILYSSKFDGVVPLVRWGIVGMLFKAVSWSMGYVIIAKGDAKVFIKTAIGFSSILLTSNILGYYYGGLEGLGISLLCYYIFHFVVIHLILKFKYEFYFHKGFYPILFVCLGWCIGAFLLTFLAEGWQKYVGLVTIILASTWFSFYQLDKKMDIKALFAKIFRRKK